MSANLEQLAESLSSLTVLELSDLSKKLEEKWGVSAATFAVAAAPSEGAGAAEVKDKFEVVLTDCGSAKIQVIKVLREQIPSLGLKEVKDMTDKLPSVVKADANKEESDKIKKALEAAGAKVELK